MFFRILKTVVLMYVFGIVNNSLAGLPLELGWKHKKNMIVATQEHQRLIFPTIKKRQGYYLCLAFKAYLYRPKPAGWNPYISVNLNGIQLGQFTRNGKKRLFCRGKNLPLHTLKQSSGVGGKIQVVSHLL